MKNNSVLLLVLLMLLASGCKCLQFQAAEKLTVDKLDTPASTWHVSAADHCISFPMLELHLYLLSGLMMCRNPSLAERSQTGRTNTTSRRR